MNNEIFNYSSSKTLTAEQKRYICSKSMNFSTLIYLFLGMYVILSMSIVFKIVGIFMILSAYREWAFARAVKNDKARVYVGIVSDKYEINPKPHATKHRKYKMIFMLDDGDIYEKIVYFGNYRRAEINDKVLIIKAKNIERIYSLTKIIKNK